MSNPLIIGLKTNPQMFLNSLDSEELHALVEACIRVISRRHQEGDETAAPVLQDIYRSVGALEL